MLSMRQSYRIIPVYTADVSGVCSALYELGGMTVMHDPSGCNSTYNTHDEIRWYDQDSLIYISGLTERDAIMGNDRKFIDDIVDAANHYLKEGTLVLHRSMKIHPKFKVYKRFRYDLYIVKNKEKSLIFSFEETKNTPAEDMIKVWDDCDKLYLRELIKWIAGDEYKSITNGI